jgi:hypothetical protein
MTKTFVSIMAGHDLAAAGVRSDADFEKIQDSGRRITKQQRIKEAMTYVALRIYTRILKAIGDISELAVTAKPGKVR